MRHHTAEQRLTLIWDVKATYISGLQSSVTIDELLRDTLGHGFCVGLGLGLSARSRTSSTGLKWPSILGSLFSVYSWVYLGEICFFIFFLMCMWISYSRFWCFDSMFTEQAGKKNDVMLESLVR